MTHDKETKRAIDRIEKILSTLDTKQRAAVLAALQATSSELPKKAANQERTNIERALETCNGNMVRAAAMLGFTRRTLQNHMRRLGMGYARNGRPPKLSSSVKWC